MAEEPRGFCLPVPIVTTSDDQSAPLRGPPMKGILKVMARLEAKAGRLMHPLRGEGLPQIFALRRNTPGDGELLFFWWPVAQVQKEVYWLT